jgi:transposase-like protein
MAPTKLTEVEKETIFRLYRETDETTSTLARQYGVSVSTISRLLKNKLSSEEYEELVRLKRSGNSRGLDFADEEDEEALGEGTPDLSPETDLEGNSDLMFSGEDGRRRRRRRSERSSDSEPLTEQSPEQQIEQLDLLTHTPPPGHFSPALTAPVKLSPAEPEEEEEDDVYSFGDEEFGDEEEDFEEEDDLDDDGLEMPRFIEATALEILPLAQARLPRICYLVIDRTAELVTCRLQDFRELGQVPESEALHRTLPLFDNHRIARRFSRRNQRVIKLPDGRVLYKTVRCLQAKGITRLFLDGKVYTLALDGSEG